MFIICPKCAAKYQIPTGITLDAGQKMKCSACGAVFLKGEEAPLVLSTPRPTPRAAQPVADEAFSTPLYTAKTELSVTPKESLPEAFQPVAATPSSRMKGMLIVLIYLALIVGLCALGWTYRDFLKQSFQDIVPAAKPAVTRVYRPARPDIIPPKVERTLPPAPVTTLPEPRPVVVPAQPIRLLRPMPQPVVTPEKSEPEVTPPAPVPDEVSDTDSDVDIPLLDDDTTQGSTATVTVDEPIFRVEPDETGVLQVLIEGAVRNPSGQTHPVPALTVVLWGTDGQELNRKSIHLDKSVIDPDEVIPFYTSITPAPSNVDHIEVQF